MTTNMEVKNGVSGILVPLSYKSSEAIEPVLINTQVAVYTDNRNVVLDPTGIKNWIQSFEEGAHSTGNPFSAYDFLKEFHEENSHEFSKLSMLLGYFFKGRTYPVSISAEYSEKYDYVVTTQVVYTDPVKGYTIDIKSWANVDEIEKVIEILNEDVQHLEGESMNITDTAFYIKHHIEKELQLTVKEVFIKKGANITIIGG